jgi:hypothetical protein
MSTLEELLNQIIIGAMKELNQKTAHIQLIFT